MFYRYEHYMSISHMALIVDMYSMIIDKQDQKILRNKSVFSQ